MCSQGTVQSRTPKSVRFFFLESRFFIAFMHGSHTLTPPGTTARVPIKETRWSRSTTSWRSQINLAEEGDDVAAAAATSAAGA